MKIKPPHISVALLFLSWLVNYLMPQYRMIPQTFRQVGILVLISGLSMTFYSFYLFKKNKTPILPGTKPVFVVMDGPYRFTRNPMYLGVTIALLGASIFIGNLISLLSPLIFFIAMNIVYIPFEEKLMEKLFGKKYINYRKNVRRWL